VFVIGKDLEAAYDAVERIDTNAYILLMGARLASDADFSAERADLEAAVRRYSG
jgi:ribulose-5-phosphate 4-epimerase/fuculose-1-phosphate aldolase